MRKFWKASSLLRSQKSLAWLHLIFPVQNIWEYSQNIRAAGPFEIRKKTFLSNATYIIEKGIHTAGKAAVLISEGYCNGQGNMFSCLNYSFGNEKDQSLFINWVVIISVLFFQLIPFRMFPNMGQIITQPKWSHFWLTFSVYIEQLIFYSRYSFSESYDTEFFFSQYLQLYMQDIKTLFEGKRGNWTNQKSIFRSLNNILSYICPQ